MWTEIENSFRFLCDIVEWFNAESHDWFQFLKIYINLNIWVTGFFTMTFTEIVFVKFTLFFEFVIYAQEHCNRYVLSHSQKLWRFIHTWTLFKPFRCPNNLIGLRLKHVTPVDNEQLLTCLWCSPSSWQYNPPSPWRNPWTLELPCRSMKWNIFLIFFLMKVICIQISHSPMVLSWV